ncbi:gliding motility-associated ABC transporter ATP-binding subunit GldA [Parasediminibacterium paludis]|uniref:Gliding motility-associated ABC transporter ATP-binding subunit GldA n=1 Tax=Parasediminibacterium paludis TaxID=908966 RepID=A0ABV8PVP9_9BACT
MSIQVNQLTKIYGTQRAVNNISFSVNKGEIVGFLGPNGAGKSTTMKMLTGYLQPDAGSLQICGLDVSTNVIAIKKKIGYLPEANPLYFDMYVKEYLAFIGGVHHISNIAFEVNSAIELTGLTLESKKKIGQLSKGYKQRVGLAAALIHSPEVLILDEPTSGLDPNQIIEIRNVIKAQGADKTVLFSSHILQEVEAICDRIIIINKGEIVADDVLSKLTTQKMTTIIVLELQEAVNIGIFAGLNAKQVSSTKWQFSTNDAEATRKQLMGIILEQQLNIVSLSNDNNSNLEDVFRDLTSKK